MPLRLLTEAEARAEWSGDLLIIRQQRIAFEDLGVMFLKTIVVALVTLPLWQGLFVEAAWIPYWLALLLALAAGDNQPRPFLTGRLQVLTFDIRISAARQRQQ